MRFRTAVLGAALSAALATAGCGASIAGEAIAATGVTVTGASTSSADPGGARPSGSAPSFPVSTGRPTDDGQTGAPQTGSSSTPTDDESTGGDAPQTGSSSTALTGIPGLSGDCAKVLASITAFSTVLQEAGSGTDETVSQATVDAALAQMPASGLPAQPQQDVTLLRATVQGAAGKTLVELGEAFSDGKVLDAIKDLSSWESAHCG